MPRGEDRNETDSHADLEVRLDLSLSCMLELRENEVSRMTLPDIGHKDRVDG